MPWVRSGDASAFHPNVLHIAEHELFDDRLINEVFGFVIRCACQSSAHLMDYVVTRGTAIQIAGASRFEVLLDVALFAGLFTETVIDDATVYKVIDTDDEFIHLRLRAEIEWERQRKRDRDNPGLTVPVRIRDGDACRWCGVIVRWNNDRKSGRAGTYDHLNPGKPATVDTYVVSCLSCNSSRKDGELPQGVNELLPPPEAPVFSVFTVKWLTENRWRADNGYDVPQATSPADLDKIASAVSPRRQRNTSRRPAASGGLPAEQPQAPLVSGPAAQSAAQGSSSRTPQPAGDLPAEQPQAPPVSGPAATGAVQGSTSRIPAASGDLPAEQPQAPPVSGPAATGAVQETRGAAAQSANPAPCPNPGSVGQAAEGAGQRDQQRGGPAPPRGGPPPTPQPPQGVPSPGGTRSARYQPDPLDRQGPAPSVPGRGGSGRVGSGRVGSPDHPPTQQDLPRRRGRRGRGRNSHAQPT